MTAIKSQGTTIEVQLADDSWESICGASISGLGSGTATEIDVTTLCSEGKEFMQGLKDEGTMNLSVFYDPAEDAHKRLQYLRDNQELGAFKVTLPDTGSEVHSFSGYVMSASLGDLSPDSVLTMDFSVRISGSITVA